MSDTDSVASATTAPAPFTRRPDDDPTYDVDPGRGWVAFAGVMLALAGVLNTAYGIAAVSSSKFFVGHVTLVIGSLHTWGWAVTVVGVAQLCIAVGIWRAAEWARWLGILSALVNGVFQFIALPAHPFLTIMLFLVDVIIVFGLLQYGGRDRHSLA